MGTPERSKGTRQKRGEGSDRDASSRAPIEGPSRELHPSSARSDCYPFDAGPYDRVHRALHLDAGSDGAATWRRAIAFSTLAWVPLLILSALQGFAWGSDPDASFLADISAHVRYLVAIPLLTLSETWCLPRLAAITRHFLSSGLVPPEEEDRMQEIVDLARRRLRHRGAELALTVAAYVITIGLGVQEFAYGARLWISGTEASGGSGLTLAGWWCVVISQPVFLIVWLAWLWRVTVWIRFLVGISRLDLRIIASHPDLAGGLRFTADSVSAFSPVGFALGAVLAASLASRMIADGVLPKERIEILAIGITVMLPICFFVLPLLVFAAPLRRARLRATRQYGTLALALGRRFEDRWLGAGPRITDEALAVPDFSATTDLYAIVDNVRRMSLTPVGLRDVLPLVFTSLIPFIPLALLLIPMDEMLRGVMRLFF